MTRPAQTVEHIAHAVEKGYRTIENGVVSGYKAIENGAVRSFAAVTDKCIEALFIRQGETAQACRERLARRSENPDNQSEN